MSAGRIRPRWRRFAGAALALVAVWPVWAQSPPRQEKMPEVWVGNRRVTAAPAKSVAPALALIRNDAPPELKRLPFRRLDPPEPVAPKVENPRAQNQGTDIPRSPFMPVGHHTVLMPAASLLPEYPAAPTRIVEPAYQPMVAPDAPIFDAPTAKEVSRPPEVRVETIRVEAAPVESTPIYVTAVAQMVGVLAALTIFCGLGLFAHLILVRKYGSSLLAPFRVEVFTTGPPAPPVPEWTMPPLKEITVLERPDEDEPPVEPNFEMPLTYEEEMALRKDGEQRQEMGVLQFIADMNRELQEQLKKLPAAQFTGEPEA